MGNAGFSDALYHDALLGPTFGDMELSLSDKCNKNSRSIINPGVAYAHVPGQDGIGCVARSRLRAKGVCQVLPPSLPIDFPKYMSPSHSLKYVTVLTRICLHAHAHDRPCLLPWRRCREHCISPSYVTGTPSGSFTVAEYEVHRILPWTRRHANDGRNGPVDGWNTEGTSDDSDDAVEESSASGDGMEEEEEEEEDEEEEDEEGEDEEEDDVDEEADEDEDEEEAEEEEEEGEEE